MPRSPSMRAGQAPSELTVFATVPSLAHDFTLVNTESEEGRYNWIQHANWARWLSRQPVKPLAMKFDSDFVTQSKGVRASTESRCRSRVHRSCVWIQFGARMSIALPDSFVNALTRMSE